MRTTVPARRATTSRRSESTVDRDRGFSTRTCFPRSRHRMVKSACVAAGVAMTTASTSAAANTCSTSWVAREGDPTATARANALASRSHNHVTWARDSAENTRTWESPHSPVPTMAILVRRTFSEESERGAHAGCDLGARVARIVDVAAENGTVVGVVNLGAPVDDAREPILENVTSLRADGED